MLHPSYTELMKLINQDSEDDTPVINSRYSIVMATAKRARQIIARGGEDLSEDEKLKPLSTAVHELEDGLIKIVHEDENAEDEIEMAEMMDRLVAENLPSDEEAKRLLEMEKAEAEEEAALEENQDEE